MDIAELPEALAALARDLEQRDDDPFTLRCHAAVLLAKRTIEERMTARAPSATLLRLASHLLPTFASDEAEMDSPEVDLEAFGIGREDPEAKLLLEHMNLGSGDAGWPHFPVAYVVRGLSAYLLAGRVFEQSIPLAKGG